MRCSLRSAATLRAWRRQSRCDAYRVIVLVRSAVLPSFLPAYKATKAKKHPTCSRLCFRLLIAVYKAPCTPWHRLGTDRASEATEAHYVPNHSDSSSDRGEEVSEEDPFHLAEDQPGGSTHAD